MAVYSLATQAKPNSSDVIQRFLSTSQDYLGLPVTAPVKQAFICVPSLRTSQCEGRA